jgi:hypothetical protein
MMIRLLAPYLNNELLKKGAFPSGVELQALLTTAVGAVRSLPRGLLAFGSLSGRTSLSTPGHC